MSKINFRDCFHLANLAAGIVISKLGTAPINNQELIDEMNKNNGATSLNFREKLSRTAFTETAYYD